MSAKTQKATEILRKDLESVESLFSKYKSNLDPARKEDIVAEISLQLVNHMSVMEQVVLPEAAESVDADKAAAQAEEDNHVHTLLAQLQRMLGEEEDYDKHVNELRKEVEEKLIPREEKLFKSIEKSDLDQIELGARVLAQMELVGGGGPVSNPDEMSELTKPLVAGPRNRAQPAEAVGDRSTCDLKDEECKEGDKSHGKNGDKAQGKNGKRK